VAIKKINLEEGTSRELSINEIWIMRKNKNPNIVHYIDSYILDDELWLIMEYLDGGTLHDLICVGSLSENEIAVVSRE
ncbi:PAK1 kinase, partial [Neodrepanis coruscans]|nr:PAK1 kinase [Neodrepanis coruscans]